MADKISTNDLKSQKSDFVIIDVRESDELEGGVIEDSISMPLGLVIKNMYILWNRLQGKYCS